MPRPRLPVLGRAKWPGEPAARTSSAGSRAAALRTVEDPPCPRWRDVLGSTVARRPSRAGRRSACRASRALVCVVEALEASARSASRSRQARRSRRRGAYRGCRLAARGRRCQGSPGNEHGRGAPGAPAARSGRGWLSQAETGCRLSSAGSGRRGWQRVPRSLQRRRLGAPVPPFPATAGVWQHSTGARAGARPVAGGPGRGWGWLRGERVSLPAPRIPWNVPDYG
jgi:hypothetical protein